MSRRPVNHIAPDVLADCQQRITSGESWASVAASVGITDHGLRYCMKRMGMSVDTKSMRGMPTKSKGWNESKANELLRMKL